MSRERTREHVTLRSVLIPLGIGLLLSLVVLILRDGFAPMDEESRWTMITDALTVPGILLTGTGLLSVVSEQGAFDGIGYTTRKAFGQILSEKRRAEMPKTYYDYVTAKREKRRQKPHTTLFVGIGFLLLAAASLAIYYSKV